MAGSKKPKQRKVTERNKIRLDYLSELANGFAALKDRELCVLAVSLLDQTLGLAIKTKFVPLSAEKERALMTGYGPVAGVGARIDLAEALGIISGPLVTDLHQLRRIRNEFAHEITAHQLDEPAYAAMCAALRLPTLASTPDGRAALSPFAKEEPAGEYGAWHNGEWINLSNYMMLLDESDLLGAWVPFPTNAASPRERFIESAQVAFYLLMPTAAELYANPIRSEP